MIRGLSICKTTARFRNSGVAVLGYRLPDRAIDRKTRPTLRFSEQGSIARDIAFRGVGVTVSDIANREVLIQAEQPSLALIGKCGQLLGDQRVGTFVLSGIAQTPHQKLLVTAADVFVVAALSVANRQFGVGNRVVRPAEQRSRLAALVVKIGKF